MNFTPANCIEIKAEVVFRSNKDGTIVVMKMDDDDMFYKINGVAAEMWQKFNSAKLNLGQIAEDLSKNYSVSAEKIIADSQLFLNKINDLNLIHIH